MSILEEIRRRTVHRVAIAYLAGTLLLTQTVETLFPIFGLTEVAVRGVVIVQAIDIMPALALSCPRPNRLVRRHGCHKVVFLLIIKLNGPPSFIVPLSAVESRESPPKSHVVSKHLALVSDVVE